MTSTNGNAPAGNVLKQVAVTMCAVAIMLLHAAPGLADGHEKQLLWGDTHLHSSFSFDAFLNDNLRADPSVAYRFAMGQPVEHPYHGARVQLDRPLDFLALSDHAEFMGVIRNIYLNGSSTEDLGLLDKLRVQIATSVLRDRIDRGVGRELFAPSLPEPSDNAAQAIEALADADGLGDTPLATMLASSGTVETDTWAKITEIADAYYRPGEFTTLVAWEWSATPGGANLHRIVVSDASGEQAGSFQPFGFDDSPYVDQLWAYLDQTEKDVGVNFVAIPHNSNISKGAMFDELTLRGKAMDAQYIATRRRWEPIAEVTQIKGDSETHPALSPDDPFADFETYPYYIQRSLQEYQPKAGDYLRPALRRGLELEARHGANPFQLGLIGSTDAHTGLSSADETNFHGKMATDSVPANKQYGFGSSGGTSGWAMSASGLAAVWAEENTREAIVAAMKRREVYATTGPRIRLRFEATLASPDAEMLNLGDFANAPGAVPMGGELSGGGLREPVFHIEAYHDPMSATLDRVQIIKGWLDAQGRSREQVYDVMLSDPARRRADGSVEPVPDTVDRRTGYVDKSSGATELATVWRDPAFDPAQSAFYYVRVLQIPTARHSFLDALALGLKHASNQPDTIQERAYSSPIWYRPGTSSP